MRFQRRSAATIPHPSTSFRASLLLVLIIPIQLPDAWLTVAFSNIRPNSHTFDTTGLKISVDESSSVALHKLQPPMQVRRVKCEGTISALPNVPPDHFETENGYDDYPLRLGLVTQGEKRLGWFESIFAPAWLKTLADLDPSKGIDRVQFLSLAQHRAIGSEREFGRNTLFRDRIVGQINAPGDFTLDEAILPALPVVAVWVQTDGDDTLSKFEILIRDLRLSDEPR